MHAPAPHARISSGTPPLPAIAIATIKPSNARSLARFHERESQGLPTTVAAATPATNASDGNRVDATHVPLVTAPATRGCRSSTTSSTANSAAPAAAASTRIPRRRHRCCTTSTISTNSGTATGRDLRQRQHELAHRDRQTAGRTSEVGGEALARRGRHRDEQREHERGQRPQDQTQQIAGVTEVALARRRDVEIERGTGQARWTFRGVVMVMSSHLVRRRRRLATAARSRSGARRSRRPRTGPCRSRPAVRVRWRRAASSP